MNDNPYVFITKKSATWLRIEFRDDGTTCFADPLAYDSSTPKDIGLALVEVKLRGQVAMLEPTVVVHRSQVDPVHIVSEPGEANLRWIGQEEQEFLNKLLIAGLQAAGLPTEGMEMTFPRFGDPDPPTIAERIAEVEREGGVISITPAKRSELLLHFQRSGSGEGWVKREEPVLSLIDAQNYLKDYGWKNHPGCEPPGLAVLRWGLIIRAKFAYDGRMVISYQDRNPEELHRDEAWELEPEKVPAPKPTTPTVSRKRPTTPTVSGKSWGSLTLENKIMAVACFLLALFMLWAWITGAAWIGYHVE